MARSKYKYSIISKDLFDIEWPNENATIAIVGISPGPSQFKEQKDEPDLKKRNKECAFAGAMRKNLVKMLDSALHINEFLGIESCASLWGDNFDDALLTSILPCSVVRIPSEISDKKSDELSSESEVNEKRDQYIEHNGKADGFFISGITYNQIKNSEVLKEQFKTFIERIESCKNLKLIVVLGKAYDVIEKAIDDGKLHLDENIIINIPHAAPSCNGKINAFIDASNGGTPRSNMTSQQKAAYPMYEKAASKVKQLKSANK